MRFTGNSFRLLFLPVAFFLLTTPGFTAEDKPLSTVLRSMYQGGERLEYRVSWTGGIKIGELTMETVKISDAKQEYELRARVKDSGLFHFFYPVNDSFVTTVAGPRRLPVSYRVIQKEGRGYEAKRLTRYDQVNGEIWYQKNDGTPKTYSVEGEVFNEFSSFFYTRMLPLLPGTSSIVPTFADGKRHEVVVVTGEEVRFRNTAVGDVNVLPVSPRMTFKGLYDKAGDTVIWITSDECRIPVRINSKIVIGSLTAELVSYENPFCGDQKKFHRNIPVTRVNKEALELGD